MPPPWPSAAVAKRVVFRASTRRTRAIGDRATATLRELAMRRQGSEDRLLCHEKYRYHALYFSERKIDAFISRSLGSPQFVADIEERAGPRGGGMQTRMNTDTRWLAKKVNTVRHRNSGYTRHGRTSRAIEASCQVWPGREPRVTRARRRNAPRIHPADDCAETAWLAPASPESDRAAPSPRRR